HVLPLQTTNYVPIILAMTIMTKNAADYGLEGVVPNPPLEYDTIEVSSPTHLALVADITDAPMQELVDLNPALLKGIAPSGYVLHVPKGSGSTLSASLQMIPADRRAAWRVHRVATGESLTAIARHYGMTAGVVATANGLNSTASLTTGDRLLIPAAYRAPAVRKSAVPARRAKTQRKRPSLTHTAANRMPRAAGGE
ncbi:MAG TPA: LysM peptidoglycan-binding domain-containing protein, partial [Bryobacteraceae bacterium]|nr:LysM peptidoglycan-binding domain-containing protein [Bryobacteraceae bacterium]